MKGALNKQREETEERVKKEINDVLDKQREVIAERVKKEVKKALRKQREVSEAEARKEVVGRNRGILAEKIKHEREKEGISAEK